MWRRQRNTEHAEKNRKKKKGGSDYRDPVVFIFIYLLQAEESRDVIIYEYSIPAVLTKTD